jgi:hypothetical protein
LVAGFFLALSLADFVSSLRVASDESTFSAEVSSLALALV